MRMLTLCTITMMFLTVGVEPVREAVAQSAPVMIAFDTMYGVDGPFLGPRHNPLLGEKGDGLPWEIESAHGSVTTDGHVQVAVHGLVFKDDPSVPANLRGTNDAPQFRALVSCITEVSEEQTKRVKTRTAGFPATPTGDANIDATIELPNPCVAPVVFIEPGDEKLWFAVTGFESEEGEE